MKQPQDIIGDITEAQIKWNEKSMLTISGVNNLSISDVETAKMYAENFL